MGEELQAGLCGENWWNSSRGSFGSSPNCSSVLNDIGSFGWPTMVDMNKAKSTDESNSDGGTTAMSMDSTFQIMGMGLSSSSTTTTDWNQSLLQGNGRGESNYNTILQENMNCQQELANTSFPISSTRYGYPSSLLQTLFDTNSPPEQSLFDNGSINYHAENDYRANLSEFSALVKPKQQVSSGLHLSNDTSFWNASVSALNDIRASFLPSIQSQFLSSAYEEKPNCPNLTAKSNNEEIRGSGVVKISCSEPTFKRPRLETPSPLPTFKVRKEKLGDRITALQQLVSPFGKTDTASVLHEAIEYIKLLHDQVNVLSTPYMKNEATIHRQQILDKKDTEGAKQDLKSRGLCLVPVSSTFPVATETTTDFWTPTFGCSFR